MRHRDQLWVEALQEKNDTADSNMGRGKGEKDDGKDFLLKRQAKDYAGASSIHGLGYLAEEGRPQFECFLWLFLVIVGFALCVGLISPIFDKWQNSPTYTSINTTNYPVWSMPFPGVTICSNLMVNLNLLSGALKRTTWKSIKAEDTYSSLTDEAFKKVVEGALVIASQWDHSVEASVEAGANGTTGEDPLSKKLADQQGQALQKLLKSVRHRCDDIFLTCAWQGKKGDCSKMFTTSRTDYGYCCSFNIINIAEQFDDDAVSTDSAEDPFAAYGEADYPSYPAFDPFDYNYGTFFQETFGSGAGSGAGTGASGGGTEAGGGGGTGGGSGGGGDGGGGTGTGTGGGDNGGDGGGSGDGDGGGGDGTGGGGSGDGDGGSGGGSGDGDLKRRKRSTSTSSSSGNSVDDLLTLNSASSESGLFAVMKVSTDVYQKLLTQNDFFGFRVLVHSPFEFPEVRGKGFVLSSGNIAYIGVGARRTTSTETVKGMSIARRGCILRDEPKEDLVAVGIHMDVFDKYSRRSCLLECRAHYLNKTCGCLPYYFPDFGTVWGVNTACNLKGLQCLDEQESIITSLKTPTSPGADCYCPLECDDTAYLPEVSQAAIRTDSNVASWKQGEDQTLKAQDEVVDKFQKLVDKVKGKLDNITRNINETEEDLEEINVHIDDGTDTEQMRTDKQELEGKLERLNGQKINTTLTLNKTAENLQKAHDKKRELLEATVMDMALIRVYYRELGIVQYVRDELYSVTDFIAASGGLIGLCMGFSLLSGAEIIYWFTVRMWTDHRRKRREEEPSHFERAT